MQPCPEYTNSELNHFLVLSVIFNKNYKEPRGGGGGGWGVFKIKKEGTFLQSCIRWCWEDNSIVIRESAVSLGLSETESQSSNSERYGCLITYTARHTHGYTHVPSH